MGGRSWAESVLGQGSTFIVELPFVMHHSYQEPKAENITAPSAELRQLRILIAEDNVINAYSLKAILTRLGHQSAIFDDGQKTYNAWQNHLWDCILMDIQMLITPQEKLLQKVRKKLDKPM